MPNAKKKKKIFRREQPLAQHPRALFRLFYQIKMKAMYQSINQSIIIYSWQKK